jgi:hypothetical protein
MHLYTLINIKEPYLVVRNYTYDNTPNLLYSFRATLISISKQQKHQRPWFTYSDTRLKQSYSFGACRIIHSSSGGLFTC